MCTIIHFKLSGIKLFLALNCKTSKQTEKKKPALAIAKCSMLMTVR